MQPAEIVEGVPEKVVEGGRVDLLGRCDPVGRLVWVVVLKLPSCLRVVQRRRVSRKLELLHHLLRAALFAFEQKRHVDLELNDLRRLILIAPWRLLKERVEALSRPCIIFFLKRNLREIILRLAEFRIRFGRLLKRCFRFVELPSAPSKSRRAN